MIERIARWMDNHPDSRITKLSEKLDRRVNPEAWAWHDARMSELHAENVQLQAEDALLDAMNKLMEECRGDLESSRKLAEWYFQL